MKTRNVVSRWLSVGVGWLAVLAGTAMAQTDPAPNQAPSIKIVMPVDGQVVVLPSAGGVMIDIAARASDLDGYVRRVEFFANGASVGVVEVNPVGAGPVTPFHLPWTVAAAGEYALTAEARDNEGASATSDPVNVKAVAGTPQLPVVTIVTTDPTAKEQNPLLDVIPDTARMVVHRTGATNQPLEVRLAVSGTATPGVDYDALPDVVTIPEGVREVELVISAVDDLLVEPEETVVVAVVPAIVPLGAELPYRVGVPAKAVAVVLDDEPKENQPPRVAILSPPNGAVVPAPETIRIVAAASDPDGWVKSVEFFDGEVSLGVVSRDLTLEPMPMDTSHPEWGPFAAFVFVWEKPAVGGHVLIAVATDDAGATTASEKVEIKILEGGVLPVLTVVATDPRGAEVKSGADGVVAPDPAVFEIRRTGSTEQALEVPFTLGGTAVNGVDYELLPLVATIPAGASSVEVVIKPVDDELAEGPETVVLSLLQLAAMDVFPPAVGGGLPGRYQVARAVIADNDRPANEPPVVELLHPHDGEVFPAGADIRLVARATDGTGTVKTVEFFNGDQSLGMAETGPAGAGVGAYGLSWPDVPAGSYVLTAVATDDSGLTQTSAAVQVKVVALQPPTVVTVDAVDAEGAEIPPDLKMPLNPAIFRIARAGDTNAALVVHFKLGGTAENGVDYDKLPLEATIPAGETGVDVAVNVLDDLLAEGPETVVLTLVPSACLLEPQPAVLPEYVVGRPGMARAVILDNESPANLPPRVAIVHPKPGSIFKAPATIEIGVATRDADGYVPKVEFFAGDEKIGEQVIYFLVPPPPGQDQAFSLTWSNVAAGTYVLRARATDDQGGEAWSGPVGVVVVPIDTQRPPLVTIVATDPIGIEPDADHAADTASFLVHRTGDLTLPLLVEYQVGGHAANGTDYELLTGSVMIPEGKDVATLVVTPLADDAVEGSESVVIELLAPACIAIYPPPPGCYELGVLRRAEAKILDRTPGANQPPRVELVRPFAGETFQAPATVKFVAMADDADGRVVKVAFLADGVQVGEQLAADPALTAADVARRAFTFTWEKVPAGRHVLTAVATDEAGATGTAREVPIMVLDVNLPPVVRVVTTDPLAVERPETLPANTAKFKVHRTGKLDADLTVFYSLHGTADNGKDYVQLPMSVVIPAGRRHAEILVQPINDTEVERVETVMVKLEPSPVAGPVEPYTIGWPQRACAVILDNDQADPGVGPLPDDAFSVSLPGDTGSPYQIEASDDLITWVPVADGVAEDGRVQFVEPGMSGLKHRFYRVKPVVMEALGLGE